jgi:ubiquinone/menaquinone biosynthesis C-methylase UbiE
MGDADEAEPTAETYSHGHHESVLRSHEWRTAENSAGYLLGRLEPGMDLLDVGCGPGTITIDLARRVAPGSVLGIDRADDVIVQANANLSRARQPGSATSGAERGEVRFATGDVYALDLPDASFDVVHAHQVLQHLREPVAALRELRRVLRPGGMLAVRDSDYAGFVWAPRDPMLDRWNELYHAITARNGAEADAGRFLLGWVQQAGFQNVEAGSSTWTFATPERRTWWGTLWADRVEQSAFAEQAVAYGLSDADELATIAAAWRRWAEQPDGYFAVPNAEVLARH